MAVTDGIYLEDGTLFARATYAPNDNAMFDAAFAALGAGGGRVYVLPHGATRYWVNSGANFCDVPVDDIEVICARGAEFEFAAAGGGSQMFRVVGKRRFSWRGGQFYKTGAVSVTSQCFLRVTNTGATNSDSAVLDGIYFEIASTSTALNNFAGISLLGQNSSTWDGRLRWCEVRNCTLRARSVQQATAQGTALPNSAYSTTKYGGHLLRAQHMSGLTVDTCRMDGNQATTGAPATWVDAHWAAGMLWVDNDEGSSYSNLIVNECDLMASDGTGGTFFQIGDALNPPGGEGGHFILKNFSVHNSQAKYAVDVVKAQYCQVFGFQIGRNGLRAAIHVGSSGTSVAGDGLMIGPGDIHNNNREVYTANGATGGLVGAFTTAAVGGYGVHVENSSNVSILPISFNLWSQDRMAVRIEANCRHGSILFDADDMLWGFKTTTIQFQPVEVPDKRVLQSKGRRNGSSHWWTPTQFRKGGVSSS